jgi:hypothetical protein
MCDINSIYNLKVIGDGYDDIGPKAYILSFYTLDNDNKIKYNGELYNNELILWKNEKIKMKFYEKKKFLRNEISFAEFKEIFNFNQINFE